MPAAIAHGQRPEADASLTSEQRGVVPSQKMKTKATNRRRRKVKYLKLGMQVASGQI